MYKHTHIYIYIYIYIYNHKFLSNSTFFPLCTPIHIYISPSKLAFQSSPARERYPHHAIYSRDFYITISYAYKYIGVEIAISIHTLQT